jgi:CMP-N,N'-diacetyllegionaminic acid synthase
MSTLFLIPARAGSQGIPGKNYKPLGGKPLIQYSLEVARCLTGDENICVSTNDQNVIEVVESLGYKTPFVRPEELATGEAGSYEVMLHALDFYKSQGREFQKLVLLQPTSPFRTAKQILDTLDLYSDDLDMVVSVKETKSNPYFLLMEENAEGWLQKLKASDVTRRQDAPVVYELNGAIYTINTTSLNKGWINSFKKVKKFVMDEVSSWDLDSNLDWIIAESLLEKRIVTIS